MDKAMNIYGNKLSNREYHKAEAGKRRYKKRFGNDEHQEYYLKASDNAVLGKYFNTYNLVMSDKAEDIFHDKSIIIGNIRMGYGHYRISMAMASAAHALGYEPYWLDLHSFENTPCGKIIRHQNKLYSSGSRLSEKSSLFNLYWEKLNSEGFRQLAYNAADQKKAELMAPICRALPKGIPFVATHVWPAQAAIHAGLTNVVNAIPDNWPMALHLSEGSRHTVQTPSAYFGYKALRGMGKHPLKPMPQGEIYYTGHYIDHELVINIEDDCKARLYRLNNKKAKRFLMTVGGTGTGKELFVAMINAMMPEIASGKVVLLINFGDHKKVYDEMCAEIPGFSDIINKHFNSFEDNEKFIAKAYNEDIAGIHAFYDNEIFSTVYTTNLLMRISDILITKPSELAFYPIPKLMIKHIGGHEVWGAIRSAEVGDGTYECTSLEEIIAMIKLVEQDPEVIASMCNNILIAKNAGIYNGAYNVIKLATDR